MKKLLPKTFLLHVPFKLFGLFLFVLISINGFTQTSLVGWDFNGLTDFGVSPLAPSTTATGLTIGGLTRGSGFTTSGMAAVKAGEVMV